MPCGRLKISIVLLSTTAWLWANRPPTFSGIVTDTLAYEDRYWSTWLEATDPDDDPLTFRLLPGAPAGININPSSGFLNWTPTNLDVGVYELVAEVSDGSLTDFLPFKLYVFNTNDQPYWTLTPPADTTVSEDSLYTFTLHADDDDARHGDAIRYILKLAPTGATIDTITGTIRWIPHNGQVRVHTFSVWAQDDSTATIQVTWSVTVSNAPVVFLNAPPTETEEDATFSFDLESNDERQGNTAYAFINGSQPEWLTINAQTGQLSGTPVNNQVGTYQVQIQVDDGNGSQALLNFTLTVTNTKPIITTSVLPSAVEDGPYTANIDADDEGLGNTSYRFITDVHPLPSWLTINPSTGVITGVPDNSHVGFYPFEVEFDDGKGGKDTASFYIEVQNTPPQLLYPNLVTEVVEDNPYVFDFNSTDDGKGNVTYQSITIPSWLTLNPQTGILSGTPRNEHVGVNTVKIFVSDGHPAGTDTLEYLITVTNRPPQILSSAITSVAEDNLYTYDVNTDDENHGATYSLNNSIAGSDLTINPLTGVLTGTFPNNLVGDHLIGVRIDDGNGGTVLHEFTLEVTNTPPRFTAVGNQVVNEDSPFYLDIQTDDEGIPSVSYVIKNAPASMTIDTQSGVIQWTPDNSMVASYTIKVIATDNHDGSDSLTFDLQVVNVAPIITSTPYTQAREDSLYWYNLESTDEGVGNTTYSLITPVSWLSLDPQTGILQGTPSDLDIGTFNLSVRVDDGNGGTAIQSWTITVNNLAPVITTDALPSAREDAPYSATLTAYPPSDGRYIWSLQGAKPSWLSIAPSTGILSGTPTNSAVGRHTVTVRVTDVNGAYTEKQFNLDVTNVQPSFLTTGKIYATEDQLLTYDLNTDDEGDEGPDIKGYTLITYPTSWLSCNPQSGILTGIPRDTDVGTFPLVVRYQDGNGGMVDLNTEIVVTNTPPQFTSLNPPTTTVEDQQYSYQFTSDDDPWGQVTYHSINPLPSGLTLSSNGLLSGNPTNAAVGVHTVNIIATDGNGGRDTLGFQLQISNAAPNFVGLAVTPSPYSQVGDSIFVYEDLPYQFDFTSDDELDGANALYTVQSRPTWLSLASAAQGIFIGTPNNAHVGVASLNITFNDGNGGSYSRTYQLKVINVAVQFTNTLTTTTATEDQAYQLDLNSTDDGQGTITYSILSGNPGWLQIDAGTGLVSSLPNRPDNNDVTAGTPITFVVDDGNGGKDTLTIIFIVQNVNDSPVWVSAPSGTVATNEDALYTTTLSASDPDVGDQISYSLLTKPSGMSINPTTGVITWTPDNSQVGSHSITAKVTDLTGSAITRSWTIQVQNNPSPINALSTNDFTPSLAVSTVQDTFYIYEDTIYTINFSSADEGSTPNSRYSFDEFPNPNWITLTNASNGSVRLSPTNLNIGLHYFKIFFTDQPGSADTSTIYLRVLNVPPVITTSGPFSATEDQAFLDSIRCTDHGSGNVTYSFLSGQPAWLTLNPTTGILSGTPTNSDVISNGSFTIQVNDGNGGIVTKAFDYTVINTNDPPVWVSAPSGTVATNEDALYTTTLNASDPDVGDQISYSLLTKPSGMSINPTTGIITWTPDNSQVGSHSITAKVTDLTGSSITRSWTIQVQNNPSPINALSTSDFTPSLAVSAVGDTFYIYEDTIYTINFSSADEGSTPDSRYSFDEFPNPNWITLTNATNGSVRLSPTNLNIGLHYFKIFFTDQPGSADTSTIYMRVLNVPPVITTSGPFSATEDQAFVDSIRCTDHGSGNVTYSFLSGQPAWLTLNPTTGILSGTPTNSDVISNGSFTIQVNDGNGGIVTKAFDYTVINTNDPPVWVSAPSGTVTTNEDALYTTTLSASDPDVGDQLSYSLLTKPSGMSINPTTGVITWTPDNSQVGSHSITAKVTDLTGSSITRSWLINVTNAPSPIFTINLTDFTPSSAVTAVADTFYIYEDTLYTINLSAADENIGIAPYYSLNDWPNLTWATMLDAAAGSIQLTPQNQHVGLDSIKVRFYDQPGSVNDATIFLRVLNSPPNLLPAGPFTATEDIPFAFDLDNTDENSGLCLYSFLSGKPSWLNIDTQTGQLSGTPTNEFVGTTQFVIKVEDGKGGSAQRSYSLTVINSNDPPTLAVIKDTTIIEDNLWTMNVSATDEDAGDVVTYALLEAPTGMTINSTTGQISWTPSNAAVGTHLIKIKVQDTAGATATQSFTITVQNVLPTFAPILATHLTEDSYFAYDINCSDENDGTVIYSLLSGPDFLDIHPTTGMISGTPLNHHVGNQSVTVQVNDGTGNVTTVWNFTVINNPPTITTIPDTTADEDALYVYDINSSDDNQGQIRYYGLVVPSWLSLDSLTGILSGTPQNANVGDTLVVIKVIDGNGGSCGQTFNLHVINTNDPPIFTSAPITTGSEDSLYRYQLAAYDPDNDQLAFSLVQSPTGMSIDANTGLIEWLPDNRYSNQMVKVQVKVSDPSGSSATQDWTISVTNTAPHFINPPNTLYATEDQLFTYDFTTDDENLGTGSYTLLQAPNWMTLTNPLLGTISGTPVDSNVTSAAPLRLSFSDGNGGSDTVTLTIAVSNKEPVFLVTSDTSATEGVPFTRDLQCDDEATGAVTYQAVTPLPAWLTLNNSTGVLSGTPKNQDVGTTALQLRVSDTHGGTSNLSFYLEVLNAPPVIVTSPLTDATEDSLYSFTCHLADESGAHSYSFSINPGWLSVNASTGLVTGTPLNHHVGPNTARLVVRDAFGAADSVTYVINVKNSLPLITTSPVTTAQEDLLYSLDVNCSDEGQGTVAYTALDKPAWLNLNPMTGKLSGTPANQHVTSGTPVRIMVDDGHAGFDTLEFVLQVLNTAPQFTRVFTDTLINEDDFFSYDLGSNDEKDGPTRYRFIGSSLPWLTLDTLTGLLAGTPLNQHVTSATPLQVQVDDGHGGKANTIFFISVQNRPPQFVQSPPDTAALEKTLWSYDFNADDEGQGTTRYSLIAPYPSWVRLDTLTGLLQATPNNEHVGTYPLNIKFDDGQGSDITHTFNLTVQNVNDPPYFTTTQNSDTTAEDLPWSFKVAALDSDLVYLDTLHSSLFTAPNFLQIDPLTGQITGIPTNADVGVHQFSIIVSDKAQATDSLTFTLTVTNVNDAPVWITQTDTNAYEDQLFKLVLHAVDDDINWGDSLIYALIQAPIGAALNGDTVSWLPNNNHVGTWQFITRVTDRANAARQDTFAVTVINTNDAPQLVKTIDQATIYEDSLWTYQFQAMDDDSAFGEKLTFSISNAPSGMSIIDSTGLVTWIPTNEHVGVDSFMVTVSDRENLSDQLHFRLTIVNTNDPPQLIALNDTIAYEDSLFKYTLKFLEVDPNDTVYFSLIDAPPGMQIDTLTGLLSWQPTNEQRDQDFRIICRIADLSGASDQDTFFIHVINTNDAPVLSGLPTLELLEDLPKTLPYSHWFAYADDIDNADSTLVWDFRDFKHLSTSLQPDSVRFVPVADFFGLDTGSVVISDGTLTDTATLVVAVRPVNDPPIISSAFPTKISFDEDFSTTIALNKYVTDVDNDTSELYWYVEPYLGQRKIALLVSPRAKSSLSKLSKELVSIAHHSFLGQGNQVLTTLLISNGSSDSIQISIDPITHLATISARPNFNIDSINFHFIVTDSSQISPLGKDSAIVRIEILPVNDPPQLTALPPITINEDSVLQVAFSEWYRFVSDVDNHDSTLIWQVQDAQHFHIEKSASTLILTPDRDWFGTDTLTVIVSDGVLADTSSWLLTYLPVNDPPVFTSIADTAFFEDDTLRIDLKPYLFDVETPLTNLHLTVAPLSGRSSKEGEVEPTARSMPRQIPMMTTKQLGQKDSITITIDPTTLVATIYGTPNYFTPPIPFKLTVYDDSLASASVTWRIAILPVNDPPVLDMLPPLTCAEDSSLLLNIADWYSYVSDVETPDDRLLWNFSSDTNLILNYDTTHQRLQIRPRPDWFGNQEITVVVIDADSATDTTKVNVFVMPRNDSPIIDTNLARQQIFQTDTLRLQLNNYVHDVDNAVNMLTWTIKPGKHVHCQHDSSVQRLKLWCGYEWFGQDTLFLTVTDPAGAADSLRLFVTVADTTRPRFRFAVYQNPLSSKLVTIEAYSDESLAQTPNITLNGDTAIVITLPDSLPFYRTNFTIDTSQIVKVLISGSDRAGNSGIQSYSFGVARISVTQGGVLSDPDTLMTFIFGPHAVEYDLCVLYLPQPEPDTLFKLAKSSLNGPVSPIVEFVAPVSQLRQPVRVVFNLERLAINQRDAAYLGLYHWENGSWHYLPTYTGLETGTYWAYTDQTGQFQIHLNTSHPVTVLSSEFTLSPNYPNPFNSQTIINYVIGVGEFRSFTEAVQTLKPVPTSIRIYNLLGQEVKTLVNTPQLPGTYTVIWDGRNNTGQLVASGPYFCVAVLGERVLHRKMLLIK